MSITNDAILDLNSQRLPTVEPSAAITTTPRPKPNQPYIPEGSQKRELSIGSTPSPSTSQNEGKRSRHLSSEFDYTLSLTRNRTMEPEQEVTMLDLLNLLKQTAKISDLDNVAKKEDMIKLQETVTSHAIEIKQLREDIAIQSKRLQSLEDSLGSQVAKTYTRINPEVNVTRLNQHGGAQFQNNRADERYKRLVFEGIPSLPESEQERFILQLCSTLSIITFQSDIDTIVSMKRRDPTSVRPPPLLVTFNQQHVRVALLRQKYRLANIEKYREVFINPDEPIEVRRNEATFRKIAYKARSDGKTVTYRSDWIKIDETTYEVHELDKIPETYRVKLDDPVNVITSEGAASASSIDLNPTKESQSLVDRATPVANPPPNEHIKLTKAGVTYAGKTAFLSHFYECDFTYKRIPYTSVEQGLHHIHATLVNKLDIAKAIMSLREARDIKEIAKKLPYTDEWNEMAPGLLAELNGAKFDQNPDLKQRLIATAPHKLVEATVDSKWGGACPYASQIYGEGQIPGQNIAGEQLTKLRDDLISDMNDIRMS